MIRQISMLLATTLVASPVLAARPAPRLSIASVNQLPQPLPLPYHTVNAKAEVAAAKARAAKSGKRLLIDLGGNWCADCRILASVMELPEYRGFLAKHFEVVTVDVGRFDQNLDIQQHYGITGRLEGVPAILVVDPKSDRLINKGRVTALADARSMTPQALADWLAQWAA
jgi:thiol-disulfide isomerase/thioredoxin